MKTNYMLEKSLTELVLKGKSKAKSMKRTRKLIKEWIDKERENNRILYFITFTFTEEYNINTYQKWNRKQFNDYLRHNKIAKQFNFILYADFGKENGRFHLHGILSGINSLDTKNDHFNKYGFTKIEKLKTDKSVNYVVKYSTKFINNFNFRILKIKNI